jgi:predicted transcriptional regulator
MIVEQFISANTTKLANEKGFNQPHCKCGGYPECICTNLSTTQAILQRWLREVHNIQVMAKSTTLNGDGKYRDYVVYANNLAINDARDEEFQTYEDAMEFGLFYALNLVP